MSFAVQQMKDGPALSSIAKELKELWRRSIAVASICQVVARRTKVKPDEAFLTGLLHGIGHLYIMAHAVGKFASLTSDAECAELVAGWHPSIGKAVLENWRASEAMAEAVGEQSNHDRARNHEPDLTDVLVVSIVLADFLGQETPEPTSWGGVTSFRNIGLTQEECGIALRNAQYQLTSLQEVLGA